MPARATGQAAKQSATASHDGVLKIYKGSAVDLAVRKSVDNPRKGTGTPDD
jgi:hypothetical protein